ncbi:hypothetical protein NOCARDAX2BIS_560010 [Nocardioides sp. AX2bis]|nr:hypothetical protein NOCARDAX2BIS_560010 [Nocardioides sp. AX2bis]
MVRGAVEVIGRAFREEGGELEELVRWVD